MFDEIRKLLSKGETNSAIEKLIEVSSDIHDKDLQNYIIAASARFNIHLKKWNYGLENNDLESQKIIINVLQLIDEVESKLSSKKIIVSNGLVSYTKHDLFEKYYDLKTVLEDSINLTDSELQEAYLKSIEIKQLMYNEIDIKLRKNYPDLIFNRLYFSDNLYDVELFQLESFPSDKSYEWFEKSTVVTAIILSLLRKFDPRKIELLLGFLLEFEHKVWQRALVGLVFALYNRENIILLYPNLVNRLGELKEITRVKDGIMSIMISLRSEGYKHHFDELEEYYSEEEFKNFKSPQHWFMPFYYDNSILKEEISSFPNVENVHLLPKLLLNDRHLSNSEKYAITLAIKSWPIAKTKNFINELRRMSDCTRDHEFDLYIRDIYNFSKLYNDENFQLSLDDPIEVYDTKIYDFLLKKKHIIFLKAEVCKELKEFEDALFWYEKYLDIEPDNAYSYCQIGRIFENKEEYKKAISFHKKAYEVDNTHTHSYFTISRCYYIINDLKKSEKYLRKLEQIDDSEKTKNDYFWLGIGYSRFLKDYSRSLPYLNKVISFKNYSYINEAYELLAYINLINGDYNQTRIYCERALANQSQRHGYPKLYLIILDFIESGEPDNFNWESNCDGMFEDEDTMKRILNYISEDIKIKLITE